MKGKVKKEYLRRTRKLLETKLNSRNLIKGINTWAVPIIRYSGPFLKWTKKELRQIDQRTRKLMTMHKALHPRDDSLVNIEDCVEATIQQLEDYTIKSKDRLLMAANNSRCNIRTNRKTTKTNMGRETLIWILQTTNWRRYT